MFTGIIEATAEILAKTESTLTLARPASFDDIKHGCSIAVSGVCLSVTSFAAASMSFDVVRTTFRKTKLGSLKVGDSVNLERSMRAQDRFEGHVVTGHTEATGSIKQVTDEGLVLCVPEVLLPYIVQHGSITIDGVALTVADITGDSLTVAIIPITKKETTLGSLKEGESVNVETDILGKYILRSHGHR